MKAIYSTIAIVSIYFMSLFSCLAQSTVSIKDKAKEARLYCKENNLNDAFCVFIDMSVHSGKKRLYAYSLKEDKILYSGLCSHGCCTGNWSDDGSKLSPQFSNVPESHCSSIGKYKIGKRGWSNWGIHVNYKLHGLDKSNSNAYARQIVLHSWDAVENDEVYPAGTPEGWGCPAVSDEIMKTLDADLKKHKNCLLWIYQ